MENVIFLLQTLLYDALILSSVGWLTNRELRITRLIKALSFSLVASFVAFVYAPIFLLGIPFVIVKLAFEEQRLKPFGLQIVYFFTLSALISGVVHSFGYFINVERLSVFWGLLIIIGTVFVVAIVFMLKTHFLRKQYVLGELEHEVKFYYGQSQASGIGFVDTGNELIDQHTMSPVMVVPKAKATDICHMIDKGLVKTWEINYYTIDNSTRSLTAFKPTLLLIDEVIVKGVVIGLCDTAFDKFDFLMQPEMVSGM